jgi:adenylate cyclase
MARRLIEELKRRRVIRVALVYLATSFVVLQVADNLVPALHLPGWTLTLIVALLGLGLLLTLSLSWALDLTPDGVEVTPPRGAPERPGRPVHLSRRAILVPGTMLLATIMAGTALVLRPEASVAGVSVAVLPFADLSDDGSQAYMGDGIAEELLNTLRAANVAVVARTSSFAYRDRGLSARQIARELGVDHIVDGSVRKAGHQLRISAQVIDVRTDRTLWSETFDRTADDIFTMQQEIAQSVASALRVRFAAAGTPGAGTRDADAYDLYLLGLYHWNRRTADGLLRALDLFTRATETDPTFARAWAGLAFTYRVLPEYGDYEWHRAATEARAAAEQAVRLDPSSAEARTALGSALHTVGELQSSLREYDHAIRLDPTFPTAHHWRGIVLDRLGRHAEARVSLLEARRLDSTSLPIHSYVAFNLAQQGLVEEALAENAALLRRAPDYRYGLIDSFILASELGRAREHAPQLRGYLRGIGEDPAQADVIVGGVEDASQRDAAVALLDSILARQSSVREISSLADLYAVLGAVEQTLELLRRQLDGSYILPGLTRYDFLRGDPRFQALAAHDRHESQPR